MEVGVSPKFVQRCQIIDITFQWIKIDDKFQWNQFNGLRIWCQAKVCSEIPKILTSFFNGSK